MRALFLALLFTAAATSHASVLFEPYVGYGLGNLSATVKSSGVDAKGTTSGLTYGGRLGFLTRHFAIVAAEFQAMDGKAKMDDVSTSDKWKQQSIFAEVGFQSAMGFRLLGGYAFDARLTQTDHASSVDTTYKGSAYKFTLGWVLPVGVAVNAEYTIYKLNSYSSAGTSTPVSDTYSKFDYSLAMVTLSVPWTFFGGGGHAR